MSNKVRARGDTFITPIQFLKYVTHFTQIWLDLLMWSNIFPFNEKILHIKLAVSYSVRIFNVLFYTIFVLKCNRGSMRLSIVRLALSWPHTILL